MHDVLVVHGGNPFLTRTSVLGVVALTATPQRAAGPIKRMDDASTFRLRVESGAVVELAASTADVTALLGPASAAPAPSSTAPLT